MVAAPRAAEGGWVVGLGAGSVRAKGVGSVGGCMAGRRPGSDKMGVATQLPWWASARQHTWAAGAEVVARAAARAAEGAWAVGLGVGWEDRKSVV